MKLWTESLVSTPAEKVSEVRWLVAPGSEFSTALNGSLVDFQVRDMDPEDLGRQRIRSRNPGCRNWTAGSFSPMTVQGWWDRRDLDSPWTVGTG